MLTKRIYLPDKCLGEECGWFKGLKDACANCPIYIKDSTERIAKLTESHRKAACKYYHRTKNVKKKGKAKKSQE